MAFWGKSKIGQKSADGFAGLAFLSCNPILEFFNLRSLNFENFWSWKSDVLSHLAIVDHQRMYVFLLINAAAWKRMEVIE